MANLVKFVHVEYKRINIDDLAAFKKVIDEKFVFTNEEKLQEYSHDETEDLSFPPEVVIKPKTTAEVSKILNYCNNQKITNTSTKRIFNHFRFCTEKRYYIRRFMEESRFLSRLYWRI